MGRPLRHSIPWQPVEITARTVQGRYLLRPTLEINELILGVLGRAKERYGVRVYGIVVLSNHVHLIVAAADARTLSEFVGYFLGNVAREVGRVVDWRERFWGRRHSSIPILSEEKLVERMRYLLANGVKEGLVRRPDQWPGVQIASVFTKEMALRGVWYNRTAEYEARRKGRKFHRHEFATRYEIEIDPLPMWVSLDKVEQKKRYVALIEKATQDGQMEARACGRNPKGADAVLRLSPDTRPEDTRRSAAPLCHADSREQYLSYRHAYRRFVEGYKDALVRWIETLREAEFPNNSLLPSLLANTS